MTCHEVPMGCFLRDDVLNKELKKLRSFWSLAFLLFWASVQIFGLNEMLRTQEQWRNEWTEKHKLMILMEWLTQWVGRHHKAFKCSLGQMAHHTASVKIKLIILTDADSQLSSSRICIEFGSKSPPRFALYETFCKKNSAVRIFLIETSGTSSLLVRAIGKSRIRLQNDEMWLIPKVQVVST